MDAVQCTAALHAILSGTSIRACLPASYFRRPRIPAGQICCVSATGAAAAAAAAVPHLYSALR